MAIIHHLILRGDMAIFRKRKVGNRKIYYIFGTKILSYTQSESAKSGGGGGSDNCAQSALRAKYFLPMHASHNETNLFVKHIINSKSYLEFGCGGSTFLLCYVSNAKIFSIDSDKNFIDFISQNQTLAQILGEGESRLKFFHIDTGEVGMWGVPKNDSKKSQFPQYSQKVFEILSPKEIDSIDTYFVDGRFRVACVLSILLHCNAQAKIIIHDFWDRAHYHAVLEFLEVIDRVDTLAVFALKPNIDKTRVKSLLREYEFVVD